jgi:hypothetical protein
MITSFVIGILFWKNLNAADLPRQMAGVLTTQLATVAATVASPWTYSFSVAGTLYETGSMGQSSSPYWWVNSGAKMILAGGVGQTIQGDLPALDKWRLAYAASHPTDTDNGYHPQNVFRMPTRSTWQNFDQQVYFRVKKDNVSASPNRNASNGLLLFNRYQNGNTLYYAGVRVDGGAVIKKKINGAYYTMAYKKVFTSGTYHRDTNPNLLPKNTWIGVRAKVRTEANGTVSIELLMDNGKTGAWTPLLAAKDDGKSYGGAPITAAGYGGIRTDFMDVEFDDYRIANL